ncbi:flagellar biosynthesis protein FlhB [Novosphingobium sp. AAP93]|uniref:EscU/YscU/HrcU family type III secretion system export apparatus switch protein n=1 Tax=Novosphingobium sp. AAP93 TaxID=1523427 RepID=UPI0006B97F18|nr:EscU/YscU/HrcU family type III secretion system export apparatus switch protein [Novosphingobium sp. AAP93]KPF84789.1 flagellar biosynthesis protein [Novosphingobium sp. AAP93]
MAEETPGEKTFAPTEKRRKDAAKNGDVLRPRELGIAIGVLASAAWLQFAGPWLLDSMSRTARTGLTWDRASLDHFDATPLITAALITALPPVLTLGAVLMGAALVSQLGLGEGRWVGGNLAPKASRLNPLSGLKRMFGPHGWIELGKGLAKLLLLGTIAYLWVKGRLPAIVGLGNGELRGQLAYSWDTLLALLYALGGGLVVIALVDYPVQYLRRMMRLRMSLQDLKDESKESEGSPERKAAIRQRQRQIAMGGLASAMKEAQFVITNPTHFSVALAYDPDKAPAPVVLAKGRGEKALAMREMAAEMAVPTLSSPALARSVYFTTRENQMIREELYAAVAAVLAFVLALKRGDAPPQPQVDVPLELRFDAEGRPEAA